MLLNTKLKCQAQCCEYPRRLSFKAILGNLPGFAEWPATHVPNSSRLSFSSSASLTSAPISQYSSSQAWLHFPFLPLLSSDSLLNVCPNAILPLVYYYRGKNQRSIYVETQILGKVLSRTLSAVELKACQNIFNSLLERVASSTLHGLCLITVTQY